MTSLRKHVSFFCICLLLIVGCRDSKVKTFPVSGIVLFEDGQPISFGVVELRVGDAFPVARGKIGSNGRFTLGTFTSDDGAVEGRHKVIVVQHAIIDNAVNDPENAKEHASHKSALIDPKFASYQTSALEVEVKPDSENFAKLRVTRFKN